MELQYKYLEIIAFEDGKVIQRFDVTGKSERQIDRMDNGININLNHEMYYTLVKDSGLKLAVNE